MFCFLKARHEALAYHFPVVFIPLHLVFDGDAGAERPFHSDGIHSASTVRVDASCSEDGIDELHPRPCHHGLS